MKRHYVTAWSPIGEWMDEPQGGASIEVYEQERGPRPTGLLDRYGRPILAVDDSPRMGFFAADE